jgi:hypothetical protein
LNEKPFGEYVEGLSYCWAQLSVDEPTVQTDDFQDSPLRSIIRRKPLIPQGLRKFKHLQRQFRRFVVGPVYDIKLQLDRGQSVPKFGLFPNERLLINLVIDPQIEQLILLGTCLKQRGLLEDTIVLWTSEFGRMPSSQGGTGRDHNPYAFTNWLCGGGYPRRDYLW